MLIDDSDEDNTPLVPSVAVRVVIRCPTVDQFIEDYHRFIKDDRIFIVTQSVQPPGTNVRFRLELADGTDLIHGTGHVMHLRPPGPDSKRPPGMVLRYVVLDEHSQEMVDRMARRRARTTPDAGVVIMEAPPADSGEVRAESLPDPSFADPEQSRSDTTAPFRIVGAAPRFGEAWRTHSVDSLTATVPANPFTDVSDEAIEYFVEWSLEWNTAPQHKPSGPTVYARVHMELPSEERSPEPKRPGLALFAIGAAAGVVATLALTWSLTGARGSPRAIGPPPPKPSRVSVNEAVKVTARTIANESAPKSENQNAIEKPVASPSSDGNTTTIGHPAVNAAVESAAIEQVPLDIVSQPPADVLIDGKIAGHTPLVLRVPAGRHALELRRPRYLPGILTVDAPGLIDVTLKRPPAVVRVTSSPSGAEVLVKGHPRGRTPLELEVPTYERCELEVTAPGRSSWRKRFYVRSPTTDLHATLDSR